MEQQPAPEPGALSDAEAIRELRLLLDCYPGTDAEGVVRAVSRLRRRVYDLELTVLELSGDGAP